MLWWWCQRKYNFVECILAVHGKRYTDHSFYQHEPIIINKSYILDLFLSTRVVFRPTSLRNHLVSSLCHRPTSVLTVISLVIIPHDRKQISFIFINTYPFLSTIFVFLSTLSDFYQQSLCFYQHELHTSNKPCGCIPVSNYNWVLHRNFQS